MSDRQTIAPINGMDSDSDLRYVESSDYLYALNIRNYSGGSYGNGKVVPVNGNIQVPFTLPTGDNKVIGEYEDSRDHTTIYFVWNGQNNHTILRYFRDKTTGGATYGTIEKVIEYDFKWSRDEKITSIQLVDGKLLYWIDNQRNHKINIEKANVTDKKLCWEIFFPVGAYNAGGGIFQVDVQTSDAGALPTLRIRLLNNFDNDIVGLAAELADLINLEPNTRITAESCDGVLEICADDILVTDVTTDGLHAFVVPENHYGGSLIDAYFDHAKYPPACNPEPSYEIDESVGYNFVSEKAFQFRCQYIYDDGEDSALGPISTIPIDDLSCDNAIVSPKNVINILFADPRLEDSNNWVILKYIRVLVREGEEGLWRHVEEIAIQEAYNRANNITTFRYRFYNSLLTTAVNEALANKIHDKYPIKSGALTMAEDRLVFGDNTHGYNQYCADFDIAQDFDGADHNDTFSITGVIRVLNYQAVREDRNINYNTLQPYGEPVPWVTPIHDSRKGVILQHDEATPEGEYPVFGGVPVDVTQNARTDQGSGMKQWLPEGGWPVYLSGTDYWALSQQTDIGTLPHIGQTTIIDASDPVVGVPQIRTYLQDGGEAFSTFEIRNVPPGTYILRVASHLCSIEDKLGMGELYDLDKGTGFHKTSTNIRFFTEFDSVNNVFLDPAEYVYEAKVVVTNSDVFIGEFLVEDQCNLTNFSNVHGYGTSGYLMDANGATQVTTLQLKGLFVERQLVKSWIVIKDQALLYGGPHSISDHNGYWHIGIRATQDTSVITNEIWIYIEAYHSGPTYVSIHPGLSVVYEDDAQLSVLKGLNAGALGQPAREYTTSLVGAFVGSIIMLPDAGRQFLVPVEGTTFAAERSTVIKGIIVDSSGIPLPGIRVIFSETGRFSDTNGAGEWDITIFQNSTFDFNIEREGCVIAMSKGACIIDLSPNNLRELITPFGPGVGSPPFNADNHYTVQDIIGTEVPWAFAQSFKRGGLYEFAIRYQDEAGRVSSVFVGQQGKHYIPFITEDLNKYFPATFPANTFKRGAAIISWAIQNSPPQWASTYQWMRTKNRSSFKLLQWVVNSVKYIYSYDDDNQTANETVASQANQVMLNIDNIVDFYEKNNSSTIGYVFEEGDRARLIIRRDGTYYTGLNDHEIVSYKEGGWIVLSSIELSEDIESGTMIEIYHPKPLAEDRVFYEFGQCFPCTDPGTDQNEHSVTSGIFDKGGDTYWRRRFVSVTDDSANFAAQYGYLIESDSISDFFPSKFEGVGRIGVEDPEFIQQRFPTEISITGNIINGTQTNNLSVMDPLNFIEIDREFGPIRRLAMSGNVLVAVCENRVVSIYVKEQVFASATDSNAIVALADAFLSTVRPMKGNFGTIHPESVAVQDNTVYGYDQYRKVAWEADNNGIDPISDLKFRSKFNSMGEHDCVLGVYDRYYKEYILSLQKATTVAATKDIDAFGAPAFKVPVSPETLSIRPGSVILVTYNGVEEEFAIWGAISDDNWVYLSILNEGQSFYTLPFGTAVSLVFVFAETVSYSKEKRRWQEYYSFGPEALSPIKNEILSFVRGQLWIHDKGALSTFYGYFIPPEIHIVFNKEAMAPKVWQSVILESLTANGLNGWEIFEVSNDQGQLSRILAGSFVKKESHWFSSFKRDLNSQAANPIVNGNVLRSTYLIVKMKNTNTTGFELRAISANFVVSERISK